MIPGFEWTFACVVGILSENVHLDWIERKGIYGIQVSHFIDIMNLKSGIGRGHPKGALMWQMVQGF